MQQHTLFFFFFKICNIDSLSNNKIAIIKNEKIYLKSGKAFLFALRLLRDSIS
jgi:hypothetical protein